MTEPTRYRTAWPPYIGYASTSFETPASVPTRNMAEAAPMMPFLMRRMLGRQWFVQTVQCPAERQDQYG